MKILRKIGRWLRRKNIYDGEGFSVDTSSDFSHVLYSEPGRSMHIQSEYGRAADGTSLLGIYINHLRWDPPNEFLVIDESKQQQIKERLSLALAKLNIRPEFLDG